MKKNCKDCKHAYTVRLEIGVDLPCASFYIGNEQISKCLLGNTIICKTFWTEGDEDMELSCFNPKIIS